jgi:hypothetical protein
VLVERGIFAPLKNCVTQYIVSNCWVNRHRMSRVHENIRFRGSWVSTLFGPVYFLFKAAYLYRRGRIQSAVIKYTPEPGDGGESIPIEV